MADLDKMSYAELVAHRAGIDKLLAERHDAERRTGVEQIRKIMLDLNITVADLQTRRGTRPSAAPKYRDPETGSTWSGRGRAPRWLSGKDRASFEIQ